MVSKKSSVGQSGTKNGTWNRPETPDTQAQSLISPEEFFRICQNGLPKEIAEAIAKGADIEARNRTGLPVLTNAIFQNACEVVRVLLEAGADVEARIKAMPDEEPGLTEGCTPLMFAAIENSGLEIVQLLLDFGAEVDAENGGVTALMYALFNGADLDVISELIERGADVNAKDEDERSVLTFACYAYTGALPLLLDAGANVHYRTSFGTSPLMTCAAYNGHPEAIDILLEAGAELNAQDSAGRTPLICAARGNRNPDVLLVLLKAGADANLTDNKGRRAIDYARENEKFEETDALQVLERASSI